MWKRCLTAWRSACERATTAGWPTRCRSSNDSRAEHEWDKGRLEHTVTSTQETPPSSPATFSPAPPAPDARESAPPERPRLLLALAALLVIAVVAVGVLPWRTNTAGPLISAKADAVAA